jgi:hypothetical protein
MNPWIPWKPVMDPLRSAEHTFGTIGIEDDISMNFQEMG